ncbi:hypothetical protein LEN26_005277, partial [Aphanomyces euteiches]
LAWAITLRKYTRSNDVVFGQVLANRDIPVEGAERILGPLLSTVPCRVQFDDSKSAKELASVVQTQHGLASTHSYASLTDIKHWSGVEANLYDSLFVYQNLPDAPTNPNEDDNDASEAPIHSGSDNNYELIVEPNGQVMRVRSLFNPSKLTWSDARNILMEFDFSLTQLHKVAENSGCVCDLWHLSPEQESFIESAARGGSHKELPFELLHHGFETRAILEPDVRAVEFKDTWLSYRELNDQANTLAYLLCSAGVHVGANVAVIMERSLEFVIGLLGVLKAGGAQVPIDATFPANRITHMLIDANVKAIVTTEAYRERMVELALEIPVIYVSSNDLADNFHPLDGRNQNPASRDDIAFVVYTSGSTGKPKGVPVMHKSMINTVTHGAEKFDFKGARILQFLAIGFDMCQWDVWTTLTHGGTLVLRNDENLDDLLQTIDMVTLTPTGLSLLGDPKQYPRLRCVATA